MRFSPGFAGIFYKLKTFNSTHQRQPYHRYHYYKALKSVIKTRMEINSIMI
ncbi:MAG: hypothetical protein JWM28_269 [Chitinophagaceae bacterium]|nr:hypothetical protein [Chitinophagaceae bacterium]